MCKSKVFGPQPFLAIQTKSRRFIYDNLDFIDENTWGYAFHGDTLPIEDVEKYQLLQMIFMEIRVSNILSRCCKNLD